jgi:hypothetical protein
MSFTNRPPYGTEVDYETEVVDPTEIPLEHVRDVVAQLLDHLELCVLRNNDRYSHSRPVYTVETCDRAAEKAARYARNG